MTEFLLPIFFVSYGFLLEFFASQKRKKESKELVQFSDFLANMIDEFYLCKNVTESIYRSAEHVEGELRSILLAFCFSLEGEENDLFVYEKRVERYRKYLKLFFLQCVNAIQFGYGKKGEESVFIRNLTELRRDVLNECNKRTQAAYLFSGFSVISIAPAICLPLVKQWGMKNMPELTSFYEGFAGKLVSFSFYVILIICYLGLKMVKQTDEIVYKRKKWLEAFFRIRFFRKLALRYRDTVVERFGRKKLYQLGMIKNGMEYWYSCFSLGCLLFLCVFFLSVGEEFPIPLISSVAAFLIGFFFMMAAYAYLIYLRTIGMSGETMGLQSVILLLFEAPNMTIGKLLETMEDYAVIFRRSLSYCYDRYSSEEREALYFLCNAEQYAPFRQLANRLIIGERLGLKKAFLELSADRAFFREQQRLDTEQEVRKKAATAQIIAFVPMFFLLFAYLILPFLAASLSQMGTIFSEMNQMKLS